VGLLPSDLHRPFSLSLASVNLLFRPEITFESPRTRHSLGQERRLTVSDHPLTPRPNELSPIDLRPEVLLVTGCCRHSPLLVDHGGSAAVEELLRLPWVDRQWRQ